MLFIEPRFFLFFLVVFAVYWAIPANRYRKLWLLGASWLFYSAWDWRFLIPMLAVTGIDWWVGVKLGETADPVRRHRLVVLALATNLSNLFFFKYFNFFADSMARLLATFGAEASWTTLNIVLPVGISFYTFHMLSYVIDVYRGELQPRRSLLDIALFAAIFPQLVAGPILRASGFLPQFDEKRSFAEVRVRACLTLFLIGYFKKACVSDNISPFVDPVFATPAIYSADALIGATLLYAVQIYCDFSGYTDMALASAGLLGYHLPLNFEWPYFARNISEFWRRWHISLSTWLRDYLYVPLGGNRHGAVMRYRNLMLTMVLGGLWHGASWNFVIWGTLHGLALCVHHLFRGVVAPGLGLAGRAGPLAWLGHLVAVAFTFWWVCLAWIFFRAVDLAEAVEIARAYVTLDAPGTAPLGLDYRLLLVVLGILHWLARRFRPELKVEQLPPVAFAAGFGAATAIVLAFVPGEYRPFVYFQF
ncbi:MAG TPA: MBOAT family O-acyltransferase [Geminicoccaceae bacterium]|nr:MBOAT family O-acyltransferase [Geminicoccus sp.]HMU51682.1 MBOAT family O-acyltransferase [Geminicoccaceae bacterium]